MFLIKGAFTLEYFEVGCVFLLDLCSTVSLMSVKIAQVARLRRMRTLRTYGKYVTTLYSMNKHIRIYLDEILHLL